MSGFSNQTNEGRVQKIVDLVDLLIKSSTSNNAERDEVWELMQPALERLSELLDSEAPEPPANASVEPSPSRSVAQQRPWATVKEMAEEASLPDLTYAMAVYLNRIDEHLKPTPKGMTHGT